MINTEISSSQGDLRAQLRASLQPINTNLTFTISSGGAPLISGAQTVWSEPSSTAVATRIATAFSSASVSFRGPFTGETSINLTPFKMSPLTPFNCEKIE
jgi:hypothetical protein